MPYPPFPEMVLFVMDGEEEVQLIPYAPLLTVKPSRIVDAVAPDGVVTTEPSMPLPPLSSIVTLVFQSLSSRAVSVPANPP